MEDRRNKRRLLAIVCLGVVLCAAGLGVRAFHRKPLHGTWLGYSYYKSEGKNIRDETFGQFIIRLNVDGTYSENGNSTSGEWSQKGDRITLTPIKLLDMTPDEHRAKYKKPDGSPSVTIERLLAMKMKPMVIEYHAFADRLIYREPTIYYEYERG